jgi:hypothetical protein
VRDRNGKRYLDCGRLATSWFEDEVGPELHRVLTEQTSIIWPVLTAATRPAKVVDLNGRGLTGYRIGEDALSLALAGTLLGRPGPERFRLR